MEVTINILWLLVCLSLSVCFGIIMGAVLASAKASDNKLIRFPSKPMPVASEKNPEEDRAFELPNWLLVD